MVKFWTRWKGPPEEKMKDARLIRPYLSIKMAKLNASHGIGRRNHDERKDCWDIVVVDPAKLQPVEMDPNEEYTYHEQMMLYHADMAQEAKKKMGL